MGGRHKLVGIEELEMASCECPGLADLIACKKLAFRPSVNMLKRRLEAKQLK